MSNGMCKDDKNAEILLKSFSKIMDRRQKLLVTERNSQKATNGAKDRDVSPT